MKNVLVHVHPEKRFTTRFKDDPEALVKLQIDNSLELGWNVDDIILATNFPYFYKGVTAVIVPDEYFCPFRPLSTKTIVVQYLLSIGFIPATEVAWVHDMDAYQNEPFNVDLGSSVAGFTDYGWSKKWCLGSYFVKSSALNLFTTLSQAIYETWLEDERALVDLVKKHLVTGYTKMNITYNFGMRHVEKNYEIADKPLKVLHFHPYYIDRKLPDTTLNIFMYGKNPLGKPLMSKRLIALFQSYGIT